VLTKKDELQLAVSEKKERFLVPSEIQSSGGGYTIKNSTLCATKIKQSKLSKFQSGGDVAVT
jgi:hypothetical protein